MKQCGTRSYEMAMLEWRYALPAARISESVSPKQPPWGSRYRSLAWYWFVKGYYKAHEAPVPEAELWQAFLDSWRAPPVKPSAPG